MKGNQSSLWFPAMSTRHQPARILSVVSQAINGLLTFAEKKYALLYDSAKALN